MVHEVSSATSVSLQSSHEQLASQSAWSRTLVLESHALVAIFNT